MSKKINQIYGEYTDLVKPFSVDESWLDVTGSLHLFAPDGKTLADQLRARIRRELGITISVGVSYNKVFAKLGSDYKKPDATTVIPRGAEREILWPLPVESMLFVGSAVAGRLRRLGICTIGDLATAEEALLTGALESWVRRCAATPPGWTMRRCAVREKQNRSRVWATGLPSAETLSAQRTSGSVWVISPRRWRPDCAARGCARTAVGVNIKDPALHSISRQKQLPDATDLARELAEAAISLVLANWDPRRPIRALTVTAFGLTDQPTARQTSLFDDPTEQPRREKRERLEQALDGLRERFGTEAVLAGGVLGQRSGTGEEQGRTEKKSTPDRGGDIASAAGGEKEKIKW